MQTEAGEIHVVGRPRLLKASENSLDFIRVLRLYLAPVSLFEQEFETFMTKILYHMPSVTSRLSLWKADRVSARAEALIGSVVGVVL